MYFNKYKHSIEHVPVIISTTHENLWENDIPIRIIDWIIQKRIGFHKHNIHKIPRHTFALREAFEKVYGTDIISCPFAKYIHIPRIFLSTYEVVRLECYRNIFFVESVHLHVNTWAQKEYNQLTQNHFTFINHENDRNHNIDRKIREEEEYFKKEKQFIDDTVEYYRYKHTHIQS